MLKYTNIKFALISLLMFFVFGGIFTSCLSPKKIVYLGDVPDSVANGTPVGYTEATKYVDPVILPNDILSVAVQTMDQNEGNAPLSSTGSAVFNPLAGFLVDKNGNIEMSLIGFVKVGGLTTAEARELIKEKAKEFYKEPVINVRIANFDVYFLGNINHAGNITIPSEKVNILEAISLAGDLPLTAKRNNILLIRTEGEQKKFVRFNLLSTDIFHSPYFYLRQRDVIYVEPSKFIIESSDNRFSRNIGLITSAISFVTLLLAFRNFK